MPSPKKSRVSRNTWITSAVVGAVVVFAVLLGVQVADAPAGGEDVSESHPLAEVSGDADTTLPDAGGVDATESEGESSVDESIPYRSGEVLVKLAEGQTAEELTASLEGLDYLAAQTVSEDDVALGWATLKLADGEAVEDAANRLAEDGVAAAAQPNYLYHLDGMNAGSDAGSDLQAVTTAFGSDDEPLAAQAFTLIDYDQDRYGGVEVLDITANNWPYSPTVNDEYASQQWWYDVINGEESYFYARDTLLLRTTDAERPTVALIDSGMSLGHEDLENNVVAWYDAVQGKVPARASFKDEMSAYNWHGTHVAGIVGAEVNNSEGIAGASANAKLLPVKVTDSNGEADTATIVRGCNYVVQNAETYNVKVMNMSIGIDVALEGRPDNAWADAIDAANRAGIMVVAAAGNDAGHLPTEDSGSYVLLDGPYADYPTYFAEPTLGAISLWLCPVYDANGNALPTSELEDLGRAYYSNYNTSQSVKVEQLGAPGNKIASTVGTVNSYGIMSGTSMAAPVISGVAALVRWANPQLTPEETKSVLYSTARDISKGEDAILDVTTPGFDQFTGFGCVDANAAVRNCNDYLSGATSTSTSPSAAVTLTPYENNTASTEGWTWESKDPAIATVDGGVVTGKSGGAAVITATKGSKTLKQIVTVHAPSLSGTTSLYTGNSGTVSFADAPVDNGTWTWASSNTGILGISVSGSTITVKGNAVGSATVTGTLSSNPNVKVSRTVTVSNAPAPTPTPVATTVMYRLYNPNSGEHFYTANVSERNMLSRVGWRYEGIGWTAPKTSRTPVYRLYNANAGDHHYTYNLAEKNMLVGVGWSYEGIGWYSNDAKKTPLYREYNPNAKAGSHNYTTNLAEHNALCRIGWRGEGIGWYGM